MVSPRQAGVQGFEPQSADPESAVLPLNDTPMHVCEVHDTGIGRECQVGFLNCFTPTRIRRRDAANLVLTTYPNVLSL